MVQFKDLYQKYKEVILYLVFGVLTTVINIIVFWLCNNLIQLEYKMSNVVAWFLAVVFAFVTNKFIVFESKNKSKEETSKEAISFVVARVATLFVDMIIMIIMIDVLKVNSLFAKVIANVVVIIINYVLSKFIVFRK